MTGCDLCPVSAVAAYMAVRGREKGPFFTFAWGAPLSREKLVRCLREALCKVGIEAGTAIVSKLGGHNCSNGGCGGFVDQDTGEVGKCSVPPVCEAAMGSFSN